jgi:hypothetical protein
MKFWIAAGVFWWIVIAVWVVRLCLGLTFVSKDQIVPLLGGSVIGGLGAWYYVPRILKKQGVQVGR